MVSRLKDTELGKAVPRARVLTGRGAGGAQMLAAVKTVASMCHCQLELFNAFIDYVTCT